MHIKASHPGAMSTPKSIKANSGNCTPIWWSRSRNKSMVQQTVEWTPKVGPNEVLKSKTNQIKCKSCPQSVLVGVHETSGSPKWSPRTPKSHPGIQNAGPNASQKQTSSFVMFSHAFLTSHRTHFDRGLVAVGVAPKISWEFKSLFCQIWEWLRSVVLVNWLVISSLPNSSKKRHCYPGCVAEPCCVCVNWIVWQKKMLVVHHMAADCHH